VGLRAMAGKKPLEETSPPIALNNNIRATALTPIDATATPALSHNCRFLDRTSAFPFAAHFRSSMK